MTHKSARAITYLPPEEAQDTIRAICGNEVDAFVVREEEELRVYQMEGADRPYRLMVERMQQGVATMDRDGVLIYCNTCFADLLQGPREQLPGSSLRDRIVRSDWAHYELLLAAARHAAAEGELSVLRADGTQVPALLTFSPLPAESGATVGVLITDLRAQKHSLRAQLLAQTMGDLLAAKDPERVTRDLFNRVATHLGIDVFFHYVLDRQSSTLQLQACMGIVEEKLRELKRLKVGKGVCGMVAEKRQPIVLADVQRSDAPDTALVRSLGIQAYACNPLIIGDQLLGTLSFGTRNRTHFSPDELQFLQTVSQYTAIAVNRIRMEQELVEQRRLYQSVTDNATLALFIIDERQQCVFMNPAAEALTGFTLEEVRGKALHTAIHHTRPDGSHFPVSECPIDRALPTNSNQQGEEVFVHKDGHFYDVEFTASPVRDSTGQAIGTVIQVQDITERKRTEERLRRIERMAAAGQLAASLAHEINNPLSSVINVLYLLDRTPGMAGEAKKYISMAESELARVARIVKQSLAYYRVGAVAKEADLAAILEESLQIFSERFQRSGIALRKKITPGISVVGFTDELRQVIDNVLLNASEAMPAGGRLVVSVCRSCNWKNFEPGVRLTIGDSGPGIAEEHWPRIFEPFFTTKQEKGTGLGLWVVRGIVLKHEGSIKIRSTKANGRTGTVVSIFLPTVSQAHHTKRPGTESAA